MTRLRPWNGRAWLGLALVTLASSSCLEVEVGPDFQQLISSGLVHSASPWFPDGEHLLFFSSGGRLWSVPSNGGQPILLADDRVSAACLSPDGAWVAYTTTTEKRGDDVLPGELWVVRSDASERLQLAVCEWREARVPLDRLVGSVDPLAVPQDARLGTDGFVFVHGWSLDGNWIAYTVAGRDELVRRDGSERQPLSMDTVSAWSPDRRHFASIRVGELDVVVPDIGEATSDPTPPLRLWEGALPSWSPDGRTLAFTDLRESEIAKRKAFLVESDGSNRRLLCQGFFPHWSPSGEALLVQRRTPELGDQLFTLAPDGSGERLLARDASFGYWSPDGRRIAFWRGPDLFVIDADGTNERKVAGPEIGAGS